MKYKGTKIIMHTCPHCDGELSYFEMPKDHIIDCHCVKCDATFDAEICHDWKNNKHYYLGKERNPKYWDMQNQTIEEGIKILEEREKKGIPPYLIEKHLIAEIIIEP